MEAFVDAFWATLYQNLTHNCVNEKCDKVLINCYPEAVDNKCLSKFCFGM